jgi:hypothetical protein
MPCPGGWHLRYDHHKLAHVRAALVTATSVDQAVAPPTFKQFRRWIANAQTEDIAREAYDGLVCESGRFVWETAFGMAKLSKAPFVNFAAVTTPVLR